MNVKVKLNHKNISHIKKLANQALVETADALRSNLEQSQTMPFDTGALQNRDGGVSRNGEKVLGTRVNKTMAKSGRVIIFSSSSYARRLYFHPEYNFQTTHNPKAGGMWFEPYISGNKKTFARKAFAKLMRGKL